MRTRLTLFATTLALVCACVFARPTKRDASATAPPPDRATAKLRRAPAPALSSADESRIRQVLAAQQDAWNRGDVDAFMNFYWKSDRTLFVGAGGVTRGWQAVLDRYRRAYPDRKAMGHLAFSDVEVRQDCPSAAVVIGQYHLQRENDHPAGVFTLNFRSFPEGWRIVVDHTTAFAAAPRKP